MFPAVRFANANVPEEREISIIIKNNSVNNQMIAQMFLRNKKLTATLIDQMHYLVVQKTVL